MCVFVCLCVYALLLLLNYYYHNNNNNNNNNKNNNKKYIVTIIIIIIISMYNYAASLHNLYKITDIHACMQVRLYVCM